MTTSTHITVNDILMIIGVLGFVIAVNLFIVKFVFDAKEWKKTITLMSLFTLLVLTLIVVAVYVLDYAINKN